MTPEAFSQGVSLIEAGAGRKWSSEEREAAWLVMGKPTCSDDLGLQAAVALLEGAETYLTAKLWIREARRLFLEAKESAKAVAQAKETAARLQTLLLPGPGRKRTGNAPPRPEGQTDEQRCEQLRAFIGEPGCERANAADCSEYIRLVLSRFYPPGHLLASGMAPIGAGR